MKSFINIVAQDLWRYTQGNFKDVIVVFPNRRSGWMFRRELQHLADKPVWAPQIASIDDWIIGLSGIQKADSLTQLIHLYPEVRKQLPYMDSFSGFMDLGEMILSDFDDVDKYLANPERLFQALKELRKIDEVYGLTGEDEVIERISHFWHSFDQSPSTHQKNWLAVWEKLFPVYQGFQQSLLKKGLGTSGMCYRHAANLVSSGRANLDKSRKTVFVGFNILTRAEELIFSSLKSERRALFYWDYHPLYTEGNHEAGRFISNYIKSFPPPDTFELSDPAVSGFFSANQDNKSRIRVVPVTSDTGQVQALVSDLSSTRRGSTAIVLSDESLLPDLILAWPDQAGKVNFTSGYPLGTTQTVSFLRAYIEACEDIISHASELSVDTGLLFTLTDHPWFSILISQEDKQELQRLINQYNTRFPLMAIEPISGMDWLSKSSTVEVFFVNLESLIFKLIQIPDVLIPLEKAGLQMIHDYAKEVVRILSGPQIKLEFKALKRILLKYFQNARITLEPEMDALNQVLGILETRLLDFDQVCILSFNEGIWPSKALAGSLIPYSLRRYFRLPTAESRDSMYSYYFYRLIQRASEVTLFYLSGHMDDNYRSGEMSRYISQLMFDYSVRVDHLTEPPLVISSERAPIVIDKKEETWRSLIRYQDDRSHKYLSASALNDYLDCPLRFALKYVRDFREPDELVMASEPRGFGKLLHLVLENIYRPFVGAASGPKREWYEKILGDPVRLENLVLSAYRSIRKDDEAVWPSGKDYLAIGVVQEFISETLKIDGHQPPLQILDLESVFYKQFGTVNAKAVIDRVDRFAGLTRIIDYKTSTCDLEFKLVSELFDPQSVNRKKEIFQVLFYSELLHPETGFAGDIIPALYRFIRFKAGTTASQVEYRKMPLLYSTVRCEYVEKLMVLLAEIFNPEVPFRQTENTNICRNCSFSGLCRRD
ncbi:MAG: PD-(D/E)XK nuclease family protein [Bacteroidota bacterium]